MNIEDSINGKYKFDNCKHRSTDIKTTIVRRCPCQGGDYEDSGYMCLSRSIFKIEEAICEYCHLFEKKDP